MTKATDKPFSIAARVYYEETDAGGIVYHANYLRFAERARTEFLRSKGWDRARQEKELGIAFVARTVEIDYLAPAYLDDLLHITAEITAIGNTSLTVRQVVTCEDKIVAEIRIVLVTINTAGKPVRFPPQLRQIAGLAVSP